MSQDLAAQLGERFPALTRAGAALVVPAELLIAVARCARDELGCTALRVLSGTDLLQFPKAEPAIQVTYVLRSHAARSEVMLHVRVPRDGGVVPSLTGLWPGAAFPEREVFDLLGVRFDGHPDLRRLLMPEDWQGHPLRRDYVYPEQYQGVAHLRDGQRFG
jgi:NADH-quinone oxidoreductase subunit C